MKKTKTADNNLTKKPYIYPKEELLIDYSNSKNKKRKF